MGHPWQGESALATVVQGVVSEVTNGMAIVALDGDAVESVAAAMLQSVNGAELRLSPGDAVLLWRPEITSRRGVVLGRVGPSNAPESSHPPEAVPDELVLEAKNNLILKCGDGSITIRADGKILIKGKDLVSHAQRVNRIKGGSVAIN